MAKNTTPLVYLILERDGQILVMRRFNTGTWDGSYSLPGGHVEDGETPLEAMVRETKEEISLDIDVTDLDIAHISYRPKHDEKGNRVDFFFRAKKWAGDPVNSEPEKCDDLKWVPINTMPDAMIPHVANGIYSSLSGVFYSEGRSDL